VDRISLRGIEVFGRHGVLPHERELGQRFVVDVDLDLDLAPAAASDDLDDTVDYGVLAARVHDVVAGTPRDLIETVAGDVAELCLADPRVRAVEVTVHKPAAPLPVVAGEVAVTVRRSRA
jgi:dihydroneopterin aldolase